MDDELQQKCNETLDNDDLLEEDKIELIEQIVDEFYGTKNWSISDKERLVLDILWKHRNKQTETKQSSVRKVKAKVVQSTVSKPLVNPPPPDPSKLLPISKPEEDDKECKSPSPPLSGLSTNATNATTDEVQDDAMSPFDILRSILGEENTDDQIHHALQKSEFDIEATLKLLMSKGEEETTPREPSASLDENTSPSTPIITPPIINTPAVTPSPKIPAVRITNPSADSYFSTSNQEKIMCKYFLQFGECLRADCKYSHDLSSRICRFWLKGECLMGEDCAFLHEIPQQILEKWTINDDLQTVNTPKQVSLTEDDFPALGAISGKKKQKPKPPPAQSFQFKPSTTTFIPNFQRETNEFVPRIAQTPPQPTTIKPQVQTPPTPIVPIVKPINKLNRSVVTIKTPVDIPWTSTANPDHEKYISYRLAALRHGEMRNKYLQLAVDRWHKNDAAGASSLSKKGQKHNNEMIDAYMNASDLLYDLRHNSIDSEVFIDLHGMELDESVDRLYEVLSEIEESDKNNPRPVYAICGAGHHFSYSKKAIDDKLSKHVKEYLDSKGYEWKEFKTNEKKFGKIIGIDPWSHI